MSIFSHATTLQYEIMIGMCACSHEKIIVPTFNNEYKKNHEFHRDKNGWMIQMKPIFAVTVITPSTENTTESIITVYIYVLYQYYNTIPLLS